MVFHRKEVKEVLPEEKVIEINAQMDGELAFGDTVNLRINGRFTGRLDTKGTLTIGQSAQVEAHVNGENIVVAGKSALLSKERDAEGLSRNIAHLLDHPEEWEAMGKAGRAFVEQFHDIQKETEALEEKYFSVLKR